MSGEPASKLPALAGGGDVVAIVPQNLDEYFKLARMIVKANLAPKAVVGKLRDEDAASAITVVLLAGAELGLKPMFALRSFTVINFKPALYGDGLINVVRASGKAKLLTVGYAVGNKKLLRDAGVLPSLEDEAEEPGLTASMLALLTPDDLSFGYCIAERTDTGEKKTVVFSIADAKRAGLHQTNPTVLKDEWNNGSVVGKKEVPNDSPWYRYERRMCGWRAAGYCLRELFGDVLGGIRSDDEQREIADFDNIRDITPASEQSARREPPAPPEIDTPAKTEAVVNKEPPAPTSKALGLPKDANKPPVTIDHEPEPEKPQAENSSAANGPFDLTTFLDRLETELGNAATPEDFEEAWGELDPMATLEGDDMGQGIANGIYNRIRQAKGF